MTRGLPPGTLERRAQTHCQRGHPLTPENTRTETGGDGRRVTFHRRCRICDRERDRARRRR